MTYLITVAVELNSDEFPSPKEAGESVIRAIKKHLDDDLIDSVLISVEDTDK